MLHTKRTWCVTEAGSPEGMAEKLTRHTWTLCTAFRLREYLFLNDSTSENGVQEYAVLTAPTYPDGPCTQVESITFGWCRYEEGLEFVRRILAHEYDGGGTVLSGLRLETPDEHDRCHLRM